MIDTIIVGAGPSGLCAAKTILQCDPQAELRILDAGSSIGGVWAEEKLYPTLKTNHFFGGMDFSDFIMPLGNGAAPNDHIPGPAVLQFIESYARHFNLTDRIQFNTRVLEATRSPDGSWKLKILSLDQSFIECRKLIIAMGVNNRPHRPRLEGSQDFGGSIIHSSELGANLADLIENPSIRTVVILGAGKSAYDAVNMASVAGKEVEWVMRKSGKGPVWVFPMLANMGPFKVQRDRLTVRRLVSFFSPTIWNDGFKWIRHCLHSTKIGTFLTKMFWAQLHADAIRDCGYRNHERTKVLEPEHSPTKYGTTGGSCKYLPDLFKRIRQGQVRVTREDVTHLSHRKIHLDNGKALHADAIITATGFSTEPTIKFTPLQSHSELGIPSNDLTLEQQKFWAALDCESDLRLSHQFPKLVETPPQPLDSEKIHLTAQAKISPFRLYRSLAPPGLTANGDRSLVFLGIFSNFANHARLEIQSLWAYAYLNDKLAIDEKKVYSEASMLSRYSRHRTPCGHGPFFPDHVFDQLPYFDVLLRDLGLPTLRKSNWFKELLEPYEAADYKNIVQEWLVKQTQ